jgi:hypothetical protein
MARWERSVNEWTGTVFYEAKCGRGKATVQSSAAHGGWWVAKTRTRSGGEATMHRSASAGKRAALRRLGCGR